ncbi:MAG: glycosyltransferase family 4 protein [Dissulfuribacterales bacterium]
MNLKPNILALIQLPPPVHGASIMNELVVKSPLINQQFSITTIPLQFASSISDISSLRLNKFIKTINITFHLIKALATKKYAFVYFTLSPIGFAFYRDLLFISILKLFHANILYHLHGKGIKKNAESNLIKKFLYNFAFKNTSVIVLAYRLAKDIEMVFNGTLYCVNNGIQCYNTDYLPKKSSIGIVQILFLSNLKRSKGLLDLIASLAVLRKRGIYFQATIAGNDGDLTKINLDTLIKKLKLDDYVQVVGPKYDNEKCTLLSNADIFCFPTHNDAFPLVLLEAMQLGKPVISSVEGAIPDIVEHGKTGLLVHQQNIEELADALQELIENEETRKKMGTEGRKKFLSCYTQKKFEENILSVFTEVAGKP